MNLSLDRQQQSNPTGLAIVVLLHALLAYALIMGLGRKVVDVMKKPFDVSIIEEIKTPPPPPPTVVQRAPKSVAPPPSFVPPPEVRLATPPVQNVITTTNKPEPEPPPLAAAAPAPAAPTAVNAALACPNYADVRSRMPYPAQAQQMGLSGNVVLEFTLAADGQINGVTVVKSTNRLFNNTATTAVNQLHCISQGHDIRVRVSFVYRLES